MQIKVSLKNMIFHNVAPKLVTLFRFITWTLLQLSFANHNVCNSSALLPFDLLRSLFNDSSSSCMVFNVVTTLRGNNLTIIARTISHNSSFSFGVDQKNLTLKPVEDQFTRGLHVRASYEIFLS